MNQLTKTLNSMSNQPLTGRTIFGNFGADHLNPKVDQMKCVITDCDKPKTPGQVACSVKHGYEFRTIRETIIKVQDNLNEKWQEWLGYYTVEQIQAYASYPYKY